MALSSEISEYVISSTDTIIKHASVLVQNFSAPTNQWDKDVNQTICLTVFGVCLIFCLAVFSCFIVVSRMRRHAKEKECELELQKLHMKEEIWNLKINNEKNNHEFKLKQQRWEIEKLKEAWEIEKQIEALKIEKNKEAWVHERDKKIWELETVLAVKEAVNTENSKWVDRVVNSHSPVSEEKDKDKKES